MFTNIVVYKIIYVQCSRDPKAPEGELKKVPHCIWHEYQIILMQQSFINRYGADLGGNFRDIGGLSYLYLLQIFVGYDRRVCFPKQILRNIMRVGDVFYEVGIVPVNRIFPVVHVCHNLIFRLV